MLALLLSGVHVEETVVPGTPPIAPPAVLAKDKADEARIRSEALQDEAHRILALLLSGPYPTTAAPSGASAPPKKIINLEKAIKDSPKFTEGMYAGKSYQAILHYDTPYCNWLVNETKDLTHNEGEFKNWLLDQYHDAESDGDADESDDAEESDADVVADDSEDGEQVGAGAGVPVPCSHLLTRGERKGQECGKPKIDGSIYCLTHFKCAYAGADVLLTPQIPPPIVAPRLCKHIMARGEKRGKQCVRAAMVDRDCCWGHSFSAFVSVAPATVN